VIYFYIYWKNFYHLPIHISFPGTVVNTIHANCNYISIVIQLLISLINCSHMQQQLQTLLM